MHGAATWLELAERARALADNMRDVAERLALLDVVADYERQARGAGLATVDAGWFGAYQSHGW